MSEKQFPLISDRLVEIINFVDSQPDKSKDKIAASLKNEFKVSEKKLESFIRLGILFEYRSVDENNNGKDFIRTGDRAIIFLRINNPERTINRINTAKALTNIGY